MTRDGDAASGRRDALVLAATTVFLRYGFKKTSMEDLARAAGVSRPGLYLHFDSKEALFKAAVVRLVDDLRAAWRVALDKPGAELDDRIVSAFEAVHVFAIGEPSLALHMNELLETANTLVGPSVADLERELVADVVRLLRSAGVAAAWKEEGLSAKDLGEHLFAASSGVKHQVATVEAYREQMRVAVRIVCSRGR